MKSIPWQIKLAFSILLLGLVAWKFPVSGIIECLKNANIAWVLLAFLLGELIILNQAFRWNYLLLVPKEQKPKFASLLKYTAVGYLFNLFAPGGVGGDAYRSIALGKAHNVIASSVASVLAAKILGLVALCLLFWVALPHSEQIPGQAIWFMALGSLFLVAVCFCLAFNPFKKGRVGQFAEKLREYRKYPLRLVAAMLGSILMQVLVVLMQWAVFKALDIPVPWNLVFIIVPITVLLTTIPISFNGIGVREWSYLYLTAACAIESELLLASLLLSYAVIILQALQGGLLLLCSRQGRPNIGV